jgi:hypothetical protein
MVPIYIIGKPLQLSIDRWATVGSYDSVSDCKADVSNASKLLEQTDFEMLALRGIEANPKYAQCLAVNDPRLASYGDDRISSSLDEISGKLDSIDTSIESIHVGS